MQKVIVIGGGFYGLMLSTYLSNKYEVHLYEQESEVMTKASSLCQMRIHTGMMYPRNIKTALSCLNTFKPFMLKFKDAIVDDFTSLYAVAKGSNIDATSFYNIQKDMGQNIKKVKNDIFDSMYVEQVFKCEEYTFDLDIIKSVLLNECERCGVRLHLNTHISNLNIFHSKDIAKIFLCNYSGITDVLKASNLSPISELVVTSCEKIYFRDNLGDVAVCVVDGDYFSTMCLPKKYNGLKTLTLANSNGVKSYKCGYISNKDNAFDMVRRFIPEVKLEYDHSDFGEKCFISSIDNQNRCCFIRKENFPIETYTILGGKVTNVFSLFEQLKNC